MSNALTPILEYKAAEVARLREIGSLDHWQNLAKSAPPPRGFTEAIARGTPEAPAFICEFKRKSPSGGAIRPGAEPDDIARRYEQAGASCLSVLTDSPSFGGTLADMQLARAACTLPVLRKDFLIDPLQVIEARAYGADAILIILAAVTDALAASLEQTALELRMGVLIEVHDRAELERANRMQSPLIGVNNRNLKTLATDLATTEALARHIRPGATLISESGVRTREDIKRLGQAGANAFLIGESLLRDDDPGTALRALVGK